MTQEHATGAAAEQATTGQPAAGQQGDPREGRGAADLPEQAGHSGNGGGPAQAGADAPGAAGAGSDVTDVEDVTEAIRDVVDPELGINVVDLGLVYGVRVDENNTATIDMTLTSAACPLTDVIEDQMASVLVGSAVVSDYEINWVWSPPWGPEKITDDGREQLRAIGFTV